MTYLEIVNAVLIRLREREVSAVSENSYSKLIGQYVNDTKREVEDAWNWNALRTTLTATTTAGVFNYELNTTGSRFRVLDALNDTGNFFLEPKSVSWFNDKFLNATDSVQTGSPKYYSFNGISVDGDTLIDVYPKPDGVYNLRFNFVIPQDTLSADSTVLLIPAEPVILGTVARAIIERGEDGGLNSAEAAAIFRSSLNDFISIDASHFSEELVWNVY